MTTRDRGSMSVYTAILAPSLFFCVMLFTNAVVRWDAWLEAHDVAAAAARAAAQPAPDDFSGDQLELGPAAEARALNVVHASGHEGTVSISGDQVVVHVTVTVDYIFPVAAFDGSVLGVGEARVAVSGDS